MVIRTVVTKEKCTSNALLLMLNAACLLCLLVIVLYSKIDPFIYSTNPNIDINLSNIVRESEADLRVIVLTYNRYKSLRRLLRSLNNAYYFNDTIVLEIWIDRSVNGLIDNNTLKEASDFQFMKGIKNIFTHTKHVGTYGQWMATWQPSSVAKEIAIIFEDDTLVSPWFYRYLRLVHTMYLDRDDINGYALQPNLKHGSKGGQFSVSSDNIVFLYPMIGKSCFSPKRNNWIKFLSWYRLKSKESFIPLVPEIETQTSWYAGFIFQGKMDTMWDMWHIYFAYHNKEWTLYPNFRDNLTLTVDWKDKGLKFDGKNKSKDNTKLVTDWDSRFTKLPTHPIYIDTNGALLKEVSIS